MQQSVLGNLQLLTSQRRDVRMTQQTRNQPATSLLLGATLAGGLLTICGGCTTTLSLSELQQPDRPTTTISYTGVRSETRRFPDYSAIDKSILASRP